MQLALSPNMPMRNASQAAGLGSMFMAMNDGTLPDWGERIIYKTAFDCIPKQRLMVLRVLAKYRECTEKGLAMKLGYEEEVVRRWLADLDALQILKPKIIYSGSRTTWAIIPEYRELFLKYDGIKFLDEMYDGSIANQSYVEEMEEMEEKEDEPKSVQEKFKAF